MSGGYRSPKLRALFNAGRLMTYKKGKPIADTEEPDVIIYVKEGYIKRHTISNLNASSVQIVYGPEDVFSLTRIYDILLGQKLYDGDRVYYYHAISSVEIYRLDTKVFKKAVASDPLMYQELFVEAGHHLRACVHGLENVGLPSVTARVAHQLAYFAQEFGQSVAGGVSLKLPLTHQDIADILSVSRETVSRAISRLRAKGLLANGDQQNLVVTDIGRLKELAYK